MLRVSMLKITPAIRAAAPMEPVTIPAVRSHAPPPSADGRPGVVSTTAAGFAAAVTLGLAPRAGRGRTGGRGGITGTAVAGTARLSCSASWPGTRRCVHSPRPSPQPTGSWPCARTHGSAGWPLQACHSARNTGPGCRCSSRPCGLGEHLGQQVHAGLNPASRTIGARLDLARIRLLRTRWRDRQQQRTAQSCRQQPVRAACQPSCRGAHRHTYRHSRTVAYAAGQCGAVTAEVLDA